MLSSDWFSPVTGKNLSPDMNIVFLLPFCGSFPDFPAGTDPYASA
jgi:hypothetical protein